VELVERTLEAVSQMRQVQTQRLIVAAAAAAVIVPTAATAVRAK